MQRICPAKEPCDTNNFSLRTARAWEYRLICRIWCDAPVWSGGSVPIASWSRGFSLGMLIIGRRARVLHPPTDKENSSGSTLLYSAQSWARRQTLFHLPRPNVRVILPLLHQPGFDRIVKDVPLILAHIRPSANDPFEVAAQPNGIAVVEHFLDLVRRKALNNIHDFR